MLHRLKLFAILFAFASVLLPKTVEAAPAAAPLALASARQFLPSIPGYIPVYIRQGDEPLENINGDLAAAFRAFAEKHSLGYSGRDLNELTNKKEKTVKLPANLAATKEDESSTHIQKIKPKKTQV